MIKRLSSERGSVEETDYEVIAKRAYAEMDAEKEGREPEVVTPKPEEEGKKTEETPEADPDEPNIEIAGAPEETTEEKPKEETEEEEPKPEKDGEEEPETPEVDLDAEITAHAEKQKMTYSDAKEDIEKTNKIVEQFKNDPKEMARALRSKDREYDKLKNEIDKAEQPPVFQRKTEEEWREGATVAINRNPDKYINAYRSRYPANAELLSDEAILEKVLDREWQSYQVYASDQESVLPQRVQEVKDKIISSIPTEDRRFVPEVKVFLEGLTAQNVLAKDFDPSYLLLLAKGKKYDADIKAAKEEAVKRTKESAKILGVKESSGHQGPVKKEVGTSLNKQQRDRAEEMFQIDDGYTPEESYKMFKDTFKDELKKNPNYI